MGVYLSAPIVEKESVDEACSGFTYGASSMQGWRVSQEDAHNCIPEFNKEAGTSFFAVYDGHGGAEVAKYCSLNFPDFVKSMMEKSKDDSVGDLIQTAFLDFDATLTEDDVVKKLKELAGTDDDHDEDDDPDVPVGRTEADMLKAEADMPLEELLAKYNSDPNAKNTEDDKDGESSGCSKSNLVAAASSSASVAAASSSSSHSSNGPVNAGEVSNNNNNKDSVIADEGGNSSSASGCGSSGGGSSSSGGSAGLGERASKTKAVSEMALADNEDDSSEDDDEDDDDEEEEENGNMWEDCEDDDDDDDEDEDIENEDGPTMDMTNEEPGSDSGCTACVVLKQKDKLIVANAGDSRCVLSRNGTAVELSFDHKPEDDPERERIEKAGGKVTADGRVNGGLNLSRAFGDHVYKRNTDLPPNEQMISALPDIKTIDLDSSDDFFVIACDGIWNFMSSQEVVDYVRERLSDSEKRKKPSLINEELFDHCLAPNILGDGTGCDNMTCIIVVLDAAQNLNSAQEHKDQSTESINKSKVPEKDDQKDSLKRAVDSNSDNGKTDDMKRVKVSEDTV